MGRGAEGAERRGLGRGVLCPLPRKFLISHFKIVHSAAFSYTSFKVLLANVNSSSGSLYVVVRPSVVCRLSVVCLSSVTFVRPTQAIEIFGNVFTPFGTLANPDLCVKILRRSPQGNPSGGGLNRRGVAKYSDFGPFQGYISETMQDRR